MPLSRYRKIIWAIGKNQNDLTGYERLGAEMFYLSPPR